MQILLDLNSIESYRQFLKIKSLPKYFFTGRLAEFPDEYADRLGLEVAKAAAINYDPLPGLWDYQRDIAARAIAKQKFAVFADCGLGKTLIFLEFVRHASASLPSDKCSLIVSPLMVVQQTLDEVKRWYGDSLKIEQVHADGLGKWLATPANQIGITNYEAIREGLPSANLGALILDESSTLKSHYGKWGTRLIRLGKGLQWKLCCTGTPAPNDRIEYANHAVFLDHFPTVNSFLARFFINRGQTQERWALKAHAIKPFYRALSHWCIFLTNPAVYGWKDNCENIPPIHVHIENVDMTEEQEKLTMQETGSLFCHRIGGITSRANLSTIAKGWHKGKSVPSNKAAFIRGLVKLWPDESTIIWCIYNAEQKIMEKTFPEAASICGETPHEKRMELIADFKAGRRKIMISKPKVLGFGLNLEVASRQVFSGLMDSYESFYQAVKRSNRYGSTRPLNVHIPVTDIEAPMVDNVLRKARQVQSDTEEQERIFEESSDGFAF